MKTPVWVLLLAASGCAAAPLGSVAELLALLEPVRSAVTASAPNWRIETPLHTDNVNCMNIIFEGTELLKKKLDMNKFGAFFQKFERLKQSLTLHSGKEEECDTERQNPKIFIEKLATFIRKASKTLRTPSY